MRKTARTPRKALVIGAGIGGLTAAIALRKAGLDVEIHERAGELTAAGSGLSVMSNAIDALQSLDLGIDLEKRGRALESYHVRTARGRLIREFPFPDIIARLGVPSVLITRSDLQHLLLDAAAGIPITLGKSATGFTHEPGEPSGEVRVTFEDGSEARGDVLIGADGFHSVVRRQLVGNGEESRDSGYICWLAVIPFTHPRFAPGSVTHYWGSGRRFGMVDMGDDRLYWWGTKNMPTAESHNWQGNKADVQAAYAGWADVVQEAVRVTPEEAILAVPSRDRVFLERWGRGPVTLLGDAAHPMLTSLGQGSGMAIEDAVVLGRHLAGATDVPAALRRYEDERRERTRALVAASRAISTFEQSENPVRRPVRDAYFKFMPRRKLTRTLEDALTFPALSA
ncbi:FAD-dependent monooxygenase [Streptomyces catenulae]|uniref:FAD-dependent monooxygenase n=1 Tax=Streptomyces catenulae TaxID=66875 RepID=A0ABV2Z4F5_9ACTN|nr:FAD-dependent monooxygenase [Streptomyces catenulae]